MKPENHLSVEQIDCLIERQPEGQQSQRARELLAEARQHLAACEACQRLVAAHREVDRSLQTLKDHRLTRPTPFCASEEELNQVAAGSGSAEETKRVLKHVSECDYCGPLLKQATEVFSADETAEESEMLSGLNTSTTRWQESLAHSLAAKNLPAQAGVASVSGIKRLTTFWTSGRKLWGLAFASAVILCVLIPSFILLRTHPQSSKNPEELLQQAYTERRNIELRIPGASFGPMRAELGDQSSWGRPRSLFQAEDLIAEIQNSHPDDAHLLYLKGEADLLNNRFDSARQNLEEALRGAPENKEIEIDLATAHSSLGNNLEAVNILRRVTRDDPKNQVAWFNLALVLDKLHLYGEAVDAWNSYLALDSTSPWAKVARDKKAAVEKVLSGASEHGPENLRSILSLAANDSQRATLEQTIEPYLGLAVSKWLPRIAANRSESMEEAEAVELIGQISAKSRGDRWLIELSENLKRDPGRRGLSSLAEAVTYSERGEYLRAKESAQRAEKDFEKVGSVSGLLRARFERVYADHLLQQGQKCYEEGTSLREELRGQPYVWLQIQAELEHAICGNMTGRMREAKLDAKKALSLAHERKYGVLYLRAVSLAATLEWTTGNFEGATKLVSDGLDEYWSHRYPAMAGYNLYAVLDSVAEDSQQWFSQVCTGREALRILSGDPDHGLRAIMNQTLANAALSSGEIDIANESFQEARRQLSHAVSSDDGIATLEATTKVGIARMEYLKGDFQSASELVSNVEPAVLRTTNRFALLDFYLVKGDILLAAKRPTEAKAAFQGAVFLCENGLKSIDSERERLVWTRLYERSYRSLVGIILRENPTEAFDWWQEYKNAPILDSGQNRKTLRQAKWEGDPRGATNIHYSLPRNSVLPNDSVLLSYIVLDDEVGAWIYSSDGIYYRRLPIQRARLDQLTRSFSDHCRNPRTDERSARMEARGLYDVLVGPLFGLIGQRKLTIETDETLDAIPFEALIDEAGEYLGETHDVSFSPGVRYLLAVRAPLISVRDVRALVVGNAGGPAASRRGLSSAPRAEDEARQIAELLPHSELLLGTQATPSAVLQDLRNVEIFHFAGHAVFRNNGSALVLEDPNDEQQTSLLEVQAFEKTPLKRTKLVVLSACATAGNDEKTLGEEKSLARMFISAGVSQVIGSRWRVDSDATTSLMETFYKRLIDGESVTRALREARKSVRSQKQYSHPYFWAAFSVFGKV